ncbi:MAG TPA: thiamine pyrophosphate-dependent enzyme [Bryobacteraceae bacterium]|jgi:pyruvate dehydrogenase (quinone)/pyruvate oxidase|nr:thiamine pyrophosphate-dependent enzyme [Bryobacteraceae bacterium]
MTASDVLVETLLDWGVEVIFGLPGDGINGFVEALRTHRQKIRYVHVRHEETAAMAASGYAKFTGKLGVCFATTGPGAIHLMNGLYDAKIDQAPVLAITGMTYHDLIGTNYLQDLNQDYFYQDLAVYNQRLMGPAHAKNIVDYACRAALSTRGVSHLALPIDYQVADMSQEKRYMRNVKGHTSEAFTVPRRIPERSQLEKAAHLLQGKKKIAILVGAGARGAREEVIQTAERLSAPVVKALLGKDVLPDDSAYTTGGTGVVGTRPSSDVFENCDALLIIGSSFPYIEFLPKPGQAVGIQIDDKPERIGLRYPVEIGLVGDAQATLRELLMYLPRNEDRAFLQQAQEGMDEWWDLMEERGRRTEKPMKPQVVAWNLGQLLEDDAIITGDSGTVTTHIARMKLRAQQQFSFSGTLCSMAAGLPYAIGAQIAYPGRQVVSFTGDGSLSMAMGDLATLAQYKLPVKIIVLKNNTLGLIKWEQMIYLGNPEYGVDLYPIDFVKVAEGCGIRGVHIEEPKKCHQQLEAALAMDGPVVIECVTDPLEPPMPPKATKAEMKHLAAALARGERDRSRISLTIGRQAMDEALFPASDYGVLGHLKNAVTGPKKED